MKDENKTAVSPEVRRKTLRKMVAARSRILEAQPFYGELLMHLQMGVEHCETAYTDMKHLVFDPEFAARLSMDEMMFVMEHEVLHCALNHCLRARGKLPTVFNIAADIVVNSNIMQSMGVGSYTLDGWDVMHVAPDGVEGCLHNAEEIYDMLMKKTPKQLSQWVFDQTGAGDSERSRPGSFDSHDAWEDVEETGSLEDEWRHVLKKDAAKGWSKELIPQSVRDYLHLLDYESKINWRSALQDFIRLHADRFDYSFAPSDRRYAGSDFVMPAFSETEMERIENIWFCVDTSGSISQDILNTVMAEIREAILLFEGIEGKISFFDCIVTEPQPFEDEESFLKIRPSGGGGTDFAAIFRYMEEHMSEELPVAVIVLTDGLCDYPPESAALEVPVLWILVDQDDDAPWGRSIHIDSGGTRA